MTKLVIKIVACYFILWIPFSINNIVLIIAVLLGNDNLLRSAEAEDNITGALAFIKICVNPLLYPLSAQAAQQHTAATESTS